jgi:hypothetical protein
MQREPHTAEHDAQQPCTPRIAQRQQDHVGDPQAHTAGRGAHDRSGQRRDQRNLDQPHTALDPPLRPQARR